MAKRKHLGKLQVGTGKDGQLFPPPLSYVQLGAGRPIYGMHSPVIQAFGRQVQGGWGLIPAREKIPTLTLVYCTVHHSWASLLLKVTSVKR